MDCKVCNQDIESFSKIDEFFESDVPYLKCKCLYCGSLYKIVDKSAKNIIIMNKSSKTYKRDLDIAKKVKLSEIEGCSIYDITDEMLSNYHPIVINSVDFIRPIHLNENYIQSDKLINNASVDDIIFVEGEEK